MFASARPQSGTAHYIPHQPPSSHYAERYYTNGRDVAPCTALHHRLGSRRLHTSICQYSQSDYPQWSHPRGDGCVCSDLTKCSASLNDPRGSNSSSLWLYIMIPRDPRPEGAFRVTKEPPHPLREPSGVSVFVSNAPHSV